jgi:recombination protein RecA
MMAKREKLVTAPKNSYFTSEKTNLGYVSTGCTVLDCALGGGYVLGRITNIVGDKSTAKTALATEALINFVHKYKNGNAAYRETEAAFDNGYAEAMGLPIKKIDFGNPAKPLITVEDFERDLTAFIEKQGPKVPGIYVLDSLDALSDEAEMERDIGEATYGGNKAKALSTMFRKMARRIEQSNVLPLVISQVRDNIGAMFGEKHKRSGGKALDFYASQIMWLAHLGMLKKTINKVERPYGVKIKANVRKNKVSIPHRMAEFEFHFGYGVEDLMANVNWLKEVGRLGEIGLKTDQYKEYIASIGKMDDAAYHTEQMEVTGVTTRVWAEIEETFIPKRRKYAMV